MVIDPKLYELATQVKNNIVGRCADNGVNLPALGKVVQMAGAGDHVEIGTLFGASAIMAAMVKEEFNLEGQIYCIDPYLPTAEQLKDSPVEEDRCDASLDEALKNFEKFGVSHRIVMFPQPSYPWPGDLRDHKFVTSYIDGDHWAGMPWMDFVSLRSRTTKFIMFDNFEEIYPAVISAALRGLSSGGWFLHYKEGTFLSMRLPFVMKDPEKDWKRLREMSAI